MRHRIAAVAVAFALAVVACSPDNGPTTTAGSPTSTAPPSTTTSTAISSTTTTAAYQPPPGTICYYLANYVAVAPDDIEVAIGRTGGTQADIGAVLNATADPSEPVLDNVDWAALIGQSVSLVDVGGDPLQASLMLRDGPDAIEASPIHVVGYTTHIRFQPGTDPSPVTGYELPDVAGATLDGQLVAVVDSGIVAPDGQPGVPEWFYGADGSGTDFVHFESIDEETTSAANPASHGTFISGMIRQMAPSKQVTFAAARSVNVDPEVVTAYGEELPPGMAPTTELHVAEAVARLMLRHPNDIEQMRALNLSLGAYTCDPENDGDLITLRSILGQWLVKYPQSQVMAAAGNDAYQMGTAGPSFVPFWPAALEQVVAGVNGVKAVDGNAQEVVWPGGTKTTVPDPPGRPWASVSAPGADLVGLGGGLLNNVPALFCWSGSSFATAVASARSALDLPPTITDYGQVEGLTYVDPGTRQVATGGNPSGVPAQC